MKDIIRMNKLAGIITESQAKRIIEILNENEGNPIKIEEIEIPLEEGQGKFEKEFVETTIKHAKELQAQGYRGGSLEEYFTDIVVDVVYMLEYGDKDSTKNIKKLLGYNPRQLK
jgi:hypothetical protein